MGLLDGLVGELLGGRASDGSPGATTNPGQGSNLLQTALAVINSPAVGGLSGLLAHLQNGGLGHAVSSWVGTGQNVPVSGEQVQNALPADVLARLASQVGLSPAELSHHLSQALPSLVNNLSPNGELPPESHVSDALGGLSQALGLGGAR